MKSTTYVEYIDREDETLDESQDEWLPLGKSFQNHVNLFVK